VTKLLKESQHREAAQIIRDGGLVAFRTETVYGLGADATNDEAVKKIFTAKGRPSSNPLIVHFHSIKHLKQYFDLNPEIERILRLITEALTVTLPASDMIAKSVLAGHATAAVRIPSCKFARKFIRACGVPIAAPSANTSTRPSPTDWRAVQDDLEGKINAIMMGRRTRIGIESTVIEMQDKGLGINILRQGGVSMKKLREQTGLDVKLATSPEELQKSPGTRFKHYSPSYPIHILTDFFDIMGLTYQKEYVVIGYSNHFNYTDKNILYIGKNARQANANLFYLLREAERILNKSKSKKDKIIVIEDLPNTDEYASVRERVQKASIGGDK